MTLSVGWKHLSSRFFQSDSRQSFDTFVYMNEPDQWSFGKKSWKNLEIYVLINKNMLEIILPDIGVSRPSICLFLCYKTGHLDYECLVMWRLVAKSKHLISLSLKFVFWVCSKFKRCVIWQWCLEYIFHYVTLCLKLYLSYLHNYKSKVNTTVLCCM